MSILLISPYHGGSHRAWAEGFAAQSQHEVSLLTLPARFWKWRMHGGAVTLARRWREGSQAPALLLATDMLDLTTFLALTRPSLAHVPAVLYMHENQLTYPLPENGRIGPMRRQLGERDRHYAFINFASMLAADQVFFNSHFHLESWFAALPGFLRHFPDYNERGTVRRLRAQSAVLPVGIDLRRFGSNPGPRATEMAPPLIIWNQRWEYDKNPDAFCAALVAVAGAGIPFRLAVCGQQFGKRPRSLAQLGQRLPGHIIHEGFADSDTYCRLLWEAAVTVSTAHHEFFGISVLEAIYCHTFPILPARLSYPELVPAAFHESCFYADDAGLVERLTWALTHSDEAAATAAALSTAVAAYDWAEMAARYDARLASLTKR